MAKRKSQEGTQRREKKKKENKKKVIQLELDERHCTFWDNLLHCRKVYADVSEAKDQSHVKNLLICCVSD